LEQFLELDHLHHHWLGQIDTSTMMDLDPKATLGLVIHNNPVAKNATINMMVGDRLGLESWDWI